MEKKAAIQRSSPSPRRAGIGGLDEHRIRRIPKKVGAYRGNSGISSCYEKKPRSNNRGPSKNPKKDPSRWQTSLNSTKAPGKQKDETNVEVETGLEIDDELDSLGNDRLANSLLNFQYSTSNHHKCNPYGKYKQFSSYYPRHAIYNKESYLQANCQFIVKEDGDYSLHTVDPDKLVDWDMIEQICLCSHENPSCPICLDTPRVARITRCGHVYCWSCMIHYLKLGDKQWRKCPICFEAIHPSDLKSVITTPSHKFKTGETIEMQLMQRKKGSMLSKKVSADSVSPTMEWKGDMASVLRSVHTKLLKASPQIVLDKIVSLELKELEEQLKEAISEQSGEEAFIEMAIQLLREKETDLSKNVEQSSKIVMREGPKASRQQQPPTKFTQAKQIMNIIQEQVPSTSMDEPAFSDDEEQAENGGEEPEQCQEPRPAELFTASVDSEAVHTTPKVASPSDFYFYYQAIDGQNIFLQPINSRCLIYEYGSLQACPEIIKAQIIDIQTHTMTQELRKRFRYLSHLPLSCEFTFCELMIRPPILSRETLSKFSNEFYERKMARQRKKREEKKLERKIEKSMAMDSFGRMLTFEPEAASVDLQSLEDFPSQIGFGSPEGANVSPPAVKTGIWGTASFANALQKTTGAQTQRKEERQPKAKPEVSYTDRDEGENLDDDYNPIPSFATAFSDAVSSALEKQGSSVGCSVSDAKRKGKNKKGKMLLFTTINGPKYS